MTHQQQAAFENTVGKGEIARYKQFLLFPQCFLLIQINLSPFVYNFDIIPLFAAELEEPEIGISGKGLTLLSDKFLDRTKLKAFADDKLRVAVMMIPLSDGEEKTGKKEKMLVTKKLPI